MNINLRKCGICGAVLADEDLDDHIDWHRDISQQFKRLEQDGDKLWRLVRQLEEEGKNAGK